jgi:HEAT repeat protein
MPPPDRPLEPPSPAAGAAARRSAVVVAGHLHDRATVDAGRGDPDPGVRASAIGAAARMGTLDGSAAAAGLSDPAPEVRRRAAVESGRLSDARSREALHRALSDPDDSVVEVAAFACGERGDADPATVGLLAQVAGGHHDSLCREAAVAALGSIGHPDGLAVVLAATDDRATVRRRAVLALAAFDGVEVTEALQRLTGDRDLQVRQAAEELLAIEQGEGTLGEG